MNNNFTLCDLLYFDFEKAASLFSQVEGGLLKEIKSGTEDSRDERNIRKYDLKLFKPEFGGAFTEKTSQLESRILHHDLLVKIEDILLNNNFAIDVNNTIQDENTTSENIRSVIRGFSYLRTEGWAVIEDYERIKKISGKFNNIAEFIGKCALDSAKKTDEFIEIDSQLKEIENQIRLEKDRNKKTKLKVRLKDIKATINKQIQESANIDRIQDWLIEGMQLFIDVFLPGRINLRIYPFETVPEFQVLANLKRDCFVDSDLENVVFSYGNKPNVKLTVLGLITSFPEKGNIPPFDPMCEFSKRKENEITDAESFEQGFRGVFGGMEGLEKFVRFSRYPNITVYPIAVYRTIRSKNK